MGYFVNFCAGVHAGILPSINMEAILINVPRDAGTDANIRKSLKMLVAARTKHSMLDSGGYQRLTNELKGGVSSSDPSRPLLCRGREMNLAPIHVIQTAVKVQPGIVTALDAPVLKVPSPEKQRREFDAKLPLNLRWMRETARLRSKYCPNIQLFIPIQCYDLHQFGLIEPTLSELHYNGLSLPTRNLDAAGISLFLLKFYQMGVRKVHLLSVSNFTGIALATYFARYIFDWCSVDATTWRIDSQHHNYRHPQDLSKISVREGEVFDENWGLPCSCPWCSRTSFTQIKHLPGCEKTAFLRRHNYHAIQQLGHELYAHSADFDSFIEHLRERNQKQERLVRKLIEALNIVHHRKDEPVETLRKILGKGKL